MRHKSIHRYFIVLIFGAIIGYFLIQYLEVKSVELWTSIVLKHSYLFLIPFGYLLLILIYKSIKKRKLLNSDIYEVDNMSGTDFELMLYYYFKQFGFRVKLTPVTHDFGADLVLKKKKRITVVQAKRWNESVGIKAVQEVVGAIRYYHADEAIVVTNSFYTKSARQLAIANDVKLFDRRSVITLIEDGEFEDFGYESDNAKNDIACPFCNSRLVLRNGEYGKFYGCSNYPACRYTRDIES